MKNIFIFLFSTAIFANSFVVSGFLPKNKSKRVWVTVENNLIKSISTQKPVHSHAIETNDYIFPGLIDMHNHLKYNVLPLWEKAIGDEEDFTNRFEWRKLAAYKKAVSEKMKPLKEGELTCAAVRWAEIKALTGGVTTIQGVGGSTDASCAAEFGVQNVETPNELGTSAEANAAVDIVTPDLLNIIGKVLNLLKSEDDFNNQDHAASHYDEMLDQHVDKETQGKFGIGTLIKGRKGIIKFLKQPSALAEIVHLAEGARDDEESNEEYEYIKKSGLARPGLVIIHGVGMTHEQLTHAKHHGVSLVWSPFSNLLLYGQTLDIKKVHELKMNLAIGSDWSPSGSKTLLDELKIAKSYLEENKIALGKNTDEEIVKMATLNGAKALRMNEKTANRPCMGEISEGCLANITLIKKKTGNPYSLLINSEQQDVNLVVVSGKILYGNISYFKASKLFENENSYEDITPENNTCTEFKGNAKAMALSTTKWDTNHNQNFSKVKTIKKQLSDALEYLDPIFTCEDSKYQKALEIYTE